MMAFGKKPQLPNEEVYQKIKEFFYSNGDAINIYQLFSEDPHRFDKFSQLIETPEDGDILVDYSKNRITDELLDKLIELAKVRGVEKARDDLMRGKKVNIFEDKPVLHCALRKANFKRQSGKAVIVDKFNIVDECEDFLEKMYHFVDEVHSNKITGCFKKPLTDVIVIGHGGFVLASQMAIEALTPFNKGLNMRFVVNIDGSAITEALKDVKQCAVLIVIISHNFDDADVLQNAETAKNWFLKWGSKKDMKSHFVAVTTNIPRAKSFGVDHDRIFRYGEYVSECHSVWSTMGIPVALSIGTEEFAKFLAGAHLMDEHFQSAPLDKNVPIVLAMIGIWYVNFYETDSQAILPYDQYMRLFPAYVQHLNMKSNGKSLLGGGWSMAAFNTSPVTWGEAGTNGQHAFYQLLHQSTKLVPCDFIIPALSHNPIEGNRHHKCLTANFLAQTEALMKGKTESEVHEELQHLPTDKLSELVPHKIFPGNRPSTSIVVRKMTPFTLGSLMALYEHKAFVQSVVWDVDHFVHPLADFSSQRSALLLKSVEDPRRIQTFDSSTNGLMAFIKKRIDPTSIRDYCLLLYQSAYDPQINEVTKKGELFNLIALTTMLFFWYLYYNYMI